MFGRKSINLSFDNDNDIGDNPFSPKFSNNSNYLYFSQNDDDENDFISQLEIYIRPNNYPDKKILIMVKSGITFEQLYKQIEDNIKLTQEFKTISKLTIKNYSKLIAEDKVKLPLKGPIDKILESGDIIYCDILSEEIWMKSYFKLEMKSFRKVFQIEYKIQKRYNFKQIQLILLKGGINIFYDELKNNEVDNTLNYYLGNILFNKKRKKMISHENGKEYKYEVFVNMHFEIFEELIHEQIRTNQIEKTDPIYFRFNEYSNFLFEELTNSKKFEAELSTIKDIAREFLTSQYNDLKSTFIFYNPKNQEYEDLILPSNDNTSSVIDLYDLTDYEEPSNFISEDMEFSNMNDYRLMNNSFSSNESLYKPNSNMIIISNVINNSESLNNSLNILKNIQENSFEESLDDNKNNISMHEILTKNESPLYDPLIINRKKTFKSQLMPGDSDKFDSLKDSLSNPNSNSDLNENSNIFFLDDESKSKKKKKQKNPLRTKTKKYKFFFENYKEPDCCQNLYNFFEQKTFLEQIKNNYKFIYVKNLIERLKVPESRNLENVDRNFFKFLQKRDKKKRESNIKYHKKLIIFLVLVLLYFLLVLIYINSDFYRIHIS